MEHLSLIYNELRALGITPNYKGYQQAVCAVQLSLEDEQRLTHICKEIYHPTAQLFGCCHTSVERNLRTICHRAWNVCRTHLQELAGYELTAPPTVSTFLAILVSYIQRIESVEEI